MPDQNYNTGNGLVQFVHDPEDGFFMRRADVVAELKLEDRYHRAGVSQEPLDREGLIEQAAFATEATSVRLPPGEYLIVRKEGR